MRSPLAVLKLPHQNGFIWRMSFSAPTCRGMSPVAVVYLRHPTDDERAIVEEGLYQGGQVFQLDQMLQWAMLGTQPEPMTDTDRLV